MSALRLCKPGEPVNLVDLGPANASTNAHVGGHRLVGESGTNGRTDADRHREYQRRYLERKRLEATDGVSA